MRSQGKTTPRIGVFPWSLLVLGALAFYLALGLGYHRMTQACYETRHADDPELDAFDNPAAVVIDTAAWPMFQLANAWNGVSCNAAAGEST